MSVAAAARQNTGRMCAVPWSGPQSPRPSDGGTASAGRTGPPGRPAPGRRCRGVSLRCQL